MRLFTEGDRVRRFKNYSSQLGPYFMGAEFTVSGISPFGGVLDPDGGSHAHEFLEAVSCGPVRTVTRKEIVPGTYGIVCIGGMAWSDKSPDIKRPVLSIKISEKYTADELRAAATTLTTIAEALEQK